MRKWSENIIYLHRKPTIKEHERWMTENPLIKYTKNNFPHIEIERSYDWGQKKWRKNRNPPWQCGPHLPTTNDSMRARNRYGQISIFIMNERWARARERERMKEWISVWESEKHTFHSYMKYIQLFFSYNSLFFSTVKFFFVLTLSFTQFNRTI